MVALVQTSPVAFDFNSVLNMEYLEAVVSGNTSIAMFTVGDGNQPVVSVVDDESNAYSVDASFPTITGNNADVFFYRRANITNGPFVTALTVNSGGSIAGLLLELSGVNAVTPVGTSGTNEGTSDTVTLTLTTPTDNEFILVYIEAVAAITVTEGSFSDLPWGGAEPDYTHTLYLQNAGPAGVKNLSFGLGGSVNWNISAITYRNAASSSGVKKFLNRVMSGNFQALSGF